MRSRPHLVPAVLAAVVTAAAVGCGGDGNDRAARAAAPVRLDVKAPTDSAVVRADVVEVRGTVAPAGAAVRVLGKAAHVSGGSFSTEVPLAPGANVIDVIATARGRGPAMTAVRVTREVPVEVPDLARMDVEEAEERVADAGLKLDVEEGGGLIEDLLPGEPGVCDQEPAAGTEVRRGTTVRVVVAKSC
jgi:hypothetical protein